MTIGDGGWAKIPLVDNEAEEPSFKETHPRVDDLEAEINKVGPSIAFPPRRKVDLAMGETAATFEIVKAKAHVSRLKAHTKREPMIESNLTRL